MATFVTALAAIAALTLTWFAGIRHVVRRAKRIAETTIASPEEHTTMNAAGAVRSVQAADITLPSEVLEKLWSPMYLERLARTYWRFLSRATLGLIRVRYDADERTVVFLARPCVLLRFGAPEYELDGERGLVRWRIKSGLLVSRAGRGGDGYLSIEVRRCPPIGADTGHVHIEVEVANFYPALAHSVARWFYAVTQSRLHVIVTHGFLRSLERLDLATSITGRFAQRPQNGAAEIPPAYPADKPGQRERTVA